MNTVARIASKAPAMTRNFAQAAKNQKYYILMYDYVEGILEKRTPFRAGHLNLAKELHAKGTMFMIGAYNNPPDGATFIFKGDSPAVCDEWLKRDPYLANKLVTDYRIREWCVVPLE